MADRDIVDVLLAEHEDFRSLFAEFDTVPESEREERFSALVARLASHEAAEEALVHAALRNEVPGGDDLADEVLAEEASAEDLLADMGDLDVTSAEFDAAFERLRTSVLDHADHEEREEFPRLREHLSDDRRRELGRRFERLRDAGPTRPHPHTPQQPAVRGMAGPIVGLFDRARDAVRDAMRD